MLRKYCPHCRTYSYSASTENPWLCATCSLDLGEQPFLQLYERAIEDCETVQNTQDMQNKSIKSSFSQ